MKIPKFNRQDQAVREAVAKRLLPEVMDWFTDPEPEDEVLEDLIKMLDSYDWDGFRLATDLRNWDPDAELVAILDAADHNYYQVRRELRMEFIAKHNITPRFKVGDAVKIRDGDDGINIGEDKSKGVLDGFINSISEDGTYSVRIPALGHITSEEARTNGRGGCVGSVLGWSEVEESHDNATKGEA